MSSTSVARVTTITARSPESFEAALKEGIARAHATLRNVSGAWVKEQKVECDPPDGRAAWVRAHDRLRSSRASSYARRRASPTHSVPR